MNAYMYMVLDAQVNFTQRQMLPKDKNYSTCGNLAPPLRSYIGPEHTSFQGSALNTFNFDLLSNHIHPASYHTVKFRAAAEDPESISRIPGC